MKRIRINNSNKKSIMNYIKNYFNYRKSKKPNKIINSKKKVQ